MAMNVTAAAKQIELERISRNLDEETRKVFAKVIDDKIIKQLNK